MGENSFDFFPHSQPLILMNLSHDKRETQKHIYELNDYRYEKRAYQRQREGEIYIYTYVVGPSMQVRNQPRPTPLAYALGYNNITIRRRRIQMNQAG